MVRSTSRAAPWMCRGPRVTLTALAPEHAGDLLALLADRASMAAFGLPPFESAAEIRVWIRAGRRDACVTSLAVLGPSDAAIGLVRFSRREGDAVVGYALHAAWRGRGLMSEALRLTLGRLFCDPGLSRILARVAPDNAASQALLTRLGFVREPERQRDPLTSGILDVFVLQRDRALSLSA